MNLIIDASNIFHRSFWMANKSSTPREDDNQSFHAFIFLRSLKSYVDKFKPSAVYCVWDKKQEPSVPCFRKVIASETYKTNRDKEQSKKVYEDYDVVEAFINALGCYNVFPFSLEADDAIAFLCKNVPGKKIIISSDRDLLQLINETTDYYDVNKKSIINLTNFKQTYNINFDIFVQYKCLIGDAADNIAKVVTPAKAMKVINKTLKLTHEQLQQYMHNFELMDLSNSYSRQPGELEKMQTYFAQLTAKASFNAFEMLCKKYNMQAILDKKHDWQQSFFTRQAMHNIVNLLRGD